MIYACSEDLSRDLERRFRHPHQGWPTVPLPHPHPRLLRRLLWEGSCLAAVRIPTNEEVSTPLDTQFCLRLSLIRGQFGRLMNRSADHDDIPAPKEYFKAHGASTAIGIPASKAVEDDFSFGTSQICRVPRLYTPAGRPSVHSVLSAHRPFRFSAGVLRWPSTVRRLTDRSRASWRASGRTP